MEPRSDGNEKKKKNAVAKQRSNVVGLKKHSESGEKKNAVGRRRLKSGENKSA